MNFLQTLTNTATNLLQESTPSYSEFQKEHTFVQRKEESNRIKSKYLDRIPIICQRSKHYNEDCPLIDKKKYLVPEDLTLGQFLYVLRKRCNINATKALFCYVNGSMPSTGKMIKTIYEEHQDPDGFLYIYYNTENTFGSPPHWWTQWKRPILNTLQRFTLRQINTSGNNQDNNHINCKEHSTNKIEYMKNKKENNTQIDCSVFPL